MPAPIIRKISSLKHRIIKHKPFYASSSNVGLWESNITSSDSLDNLFDGALTKSGLSGTSSFSTASFSASHLESNSNSGSYPLGYTLTFDLGKERTIDHIRIYNGTNVINNVFYKNPAGHVANTPHNIPTASLPIRFKFWSGGQNPITDNPVTQSHSLPGTTGPSNESSWIYFTSSLDQFIYEPPKGTNYQFVTLEISGGYYSSSGYERSHSRDDVVSIKEIDIYESIDTKDYNVEFDDSLLDLQSWAGPRWKGCKTIGKKINEYHAPDEGYGIGYAPIQGYSLKHGNHGFIVDSDYFGSKYEGDKTYGLKPNVENKTTALYIASTVIGGEEDPQFAAIRNHSYINIEKILIINPDDDTVKILEKPSQPFLTYHRFITNDFPTGAKFHIKLIDKYLQSNLKDEYTVKMNKGWLLKSFEYNAALGPLPGMDKDKTTEISHVSRSIANPLVLYDAVAGHIIDGVAGGVLGVDLSGTNNWYARDGSSGAQTVLNRAAFSSSVATYQYQFYGSGSIQSGSNIKTGYDFYTSSYNPNAGGQLRFRYGTTNYVADNRLNDSGSYIMQPLYTGDNTKFIENKFTREFIKTENNPKEKVKSFTFPNIETLEAVYDDEFKQWYTSSQHNPSMTASLFIGNCIDYLNSHSLDTELHLTLFRGTKDFSNLNDELSIGTFEVDKNLTTAYLDITSSFDVGPLTNNVGPRSKVIRLKNQPQFKPTIPLLSGSENRVFYETIESKHYLAEIMEIQNPWVYGPGTPHRNLITGSGQDTTTTIFEHTYNYGFQGSGYPVDFNTNISDTRTTFYRNIEGMNSSGLISSSIHANDSQNFSGSFHYQLSFLDKDHTLIADVDKYSELFDGIGGSGIVLIPKHTSRIVKNNIEYYLEIAGLLPKTTATKKDTTNPD
tara:strand:- start:5389 stop:8076 length:2688 start_codon:yes stop_codon:yes gene_type:complete